MEIPLLTEMDSSLLKITMKAGHPLQANQPTQPQLSELAEVLKKEATTTSRSESTSYLMEEGIVRQSLCPWDGARMFHVDVVHSRQFGNLRRFAATVANGAGAWGALSFLSYEFV